MNLFGVYTITNISGRHHHLSYQIKDVSLAYQKLFVYRLKKANPSVKTVDIIRVDRLVDANYNDECRDAPYDFIGQARVNSKETLYFWFSLEKNKPSSEKNEKDETLVISKSDSIYPYKEEYRQRSQQKSLSDLQSKEAQKLLGTVRVDYCYRLDLFKPHLTQHKDEPKEEFDN